MLTKQFFTVDANGTKRAGIIWLPADYNTNSTPCPLLIFNHGVGETGDGTLNTVDKLLLNGSPLSVANSNGNMDYVNPFDKKTYRFIVIGLQGINGWCCYADQVAYVSKDAIKNYKIDPNAVYVTGLSAGGETTWETLGGPNASVFAGGVPFSTPAINTSIVDWSKVSKVWALHGTDDGGQTAYINSDRYVKAINAIHSGYAHLTGYKGGHCCWESYYSPSFKESFTSDWDSNGKPYSKSLNIYEILLAFKKGQSFLFSDNTPPVTPPASLTKAVATVSISGNVVTMNPTGSTGNIGIASSGWFISDAKGSYVKPQNVISGAMDYGKGNPSQTVITLPNGVYNVRLTIQDVYGDTDKLTVPIVIGISTGPVVVQTFTSGSTTYTLYSDNTWK